MPGWGVPGVETASLGAVIAVLGIAVGAFYLLYEGKGRGGVDVLS
jgi:hypothetical protein